MSLYNQYAFNVPLHSHGQDRTIAVWDMKSPKDIVLRRVLVGHRAAVNVVDFDEKYIVSASGDRTIKVRVGVVRGRRGRREEREEEEERGRGGER